MNCQTQIPNSLTQLPEEVGGRVEEQIQKNQKTNAKLSRSQEQTGDCHLVHTQQPVWGWREGAEDKLGLQPTQHTPMEPHQ